MKAKIIIILLSLSLSVRADVIPIPHDVATIEALIDLHKTLIDLYQSGQVQEEVTAASQYSLKEMSKKANNVLSNLHLKMSKAYAELEQAAFLVRMVEKSYKIIGDYTDMSTKIFKMTGSNPLILLKYSDITLKCSKHIKKIKELIVLNTSIEANLLKLDDKQRMDFLFLLDNELDYLESYISWQLFYIQMLDSDYISFESIWDIMNSETLDRIAAEVIASISK